MALFSREDRTFNLELTRQGNAVTEQLHVGGSPPRAVPYLNEAAALDAFRRRVLEIVEDGWRLSLADADLDRPVARDELQEHAIVQCGEGDEDERAARLAVYRDWLIDHGDPCGELASLRARQETDPDPTLGGAIQQLELARERELFGLLTALPNFRDGLKPLYRHGWIDGFEVATSSGTLTTFSLLAPMSRFVRRLVLLRTHSPEFRSAVALSSRRGQIRTLELGTHGYAQELLDVLPNLHTFQILGGTPVLRGHPGVKKLVALVERGGGLHGSWPSLRELELRVGEHTLGWRDLFADRDLDMPLFETLTLSGVPVVVERYTASLPPSVKAMLST